MNRQPPPTEQHVEIAVARSIAEVSAAEWDACAAPEAGGGRARNPFATHAFLHALEASGSVTAQAGWAPHHLVAQVSGRVEAVMPLYLKGNSQGEYVFDHSWAHAWERAGGAYYPKLQCAVPFTPVTGPRLLVRRDAVAGVEAMQGALLEAAREVCERGGLSSLHVTFCTDREWELGGRLGFLQRTDQQFHWQNRGYRDYDDFLAALSSRKRKALKKERMRAVEGGLRIRHLTGDDIHSRDWDAFWSFYQDTAARKWGRPYLNRRFFEILHETMREDVLLVMCERSGRRIAGALNIIGRDTLFGRYWGCIEEHPFLHFETCYHQAIDFALAHGLSRVEAGAQGAHKLARGYEPVTTRSLHWIPDPGFRAAVERYLVQERAAVAEEGAALAEFTPFRKGG